MGVGGQRYTPGTLPSGKRPGTYFRVVGWAPGHVWTDVENLAPTGIRSLDRPSSDEPLYRLRHPGLVT
jgi:hypothetical protein